MNVLLTIDGSVNSDWACETVCNMSGMEDATIYLIHVTHPIPEPPMPFPDVFVENDMIVREQIEKEHEVTSGRRLEAYRETLPSNLQVIPEHRVGSAATEILAAAEEHRADLIVMGARGVDEVPFGGLGSVSQKVTRYAPCHVLVTREPGTRLNHLLVTLDEGAHSHGVLEYVATAPWLRNSTLTLTHVVENRYLNESRIAAAQFAGSEAYLSRLQTTLVREGQDFLDRQVADLKERGLKADSLVLEGEPAPVIQDRVDSGSFDLVVMGAKGRHGLAHFIMGSTSQKILRHAAVSTLLVRPETV